MISDTPWNYLCTIQNPAVYLSGARIRLSPTLVPRLLQVLTLVKLDCYDLSHEVVSVAAHHDTGPDSSVVRAFSGEVGRRFTPWLCNTKGKSLCSHDIISPQS